MLTPKWSVIQKAFFLFPYRKSYIFHSDHVPDIIVDPLLSGQMEDVPGPTSREESVNQPTQSGQSIAHETTQSRRFSDFSVLSEEEHKRIS